MNTNKYPQNRIQSIDALRAFTLIGILFIHASQLFNYYNSYNDVSFTGVEHNAIFMFIDKCLTSRFRIIFSILFGISFYLLSNNSYYTKEKFAWRCMILIVIGIINKIFYTTDILFMYGICGIMMLPFLKLKRKNLFCVAIFLWSIRYFFYYSNIQFIELRDYGIRYLIQDNILNVIRYPLYSAIFDYITIIFPWGICETLSYFLIGYLIAQTRLIYQFDDFKIGNKCGMILILITIIFGGIFHFTYDIFTKSIFYLLSAVTYSYMFVCIYNCIKSFFSKISVLEKMGRLGLTNYTLMDLLGVLFVSTFVYKYQLTFNDVLLFSFTISGFLLILSNIWLKYNKNGPLETVWRKLTNLCYQSWSQL